MGWNSHGDIMEDIKAAKEKVMKEVGKMEVSEDFLDIFIGKRPKMPELDVQEWKTK